MAQGKKTKAHLLLEEAFSNLDRGRSAIDNALLEVAYDMELHDQVSDAQDYAERATECARAALRHLEAEK